MMSKGILKTCVLYSKQSLEIGIKYYNENVYLKTEHYHEIASVQYFKLRKRGKSNFSHAVNWMHLLCLYLNEKTLAGQNFMHISSLKKMIKSTYASLLFENLRWPDKNSQIWLLARTTRIKNLSLNLLTDRY